MFKTALPLLFGFSALFSVTPVALSAPEVLPQATASSYPSECPASQKDSIDLYPVIYTQGTPQAPVQTDKGYGYKYERYGFVQTECEKDVPVPEKCGAGSFASTFYYDKFGTYLSRDPYNYVANDRTCSTQHNNWTWAEWNGKWGWKETVCILEEVGNDSCNQHGPHVHKNSWFVVVSYFKAVPPTPYPYPAHYPYPYPAHYPYPGHYPYPYPYPGHYPYPYPANYPTPINIPDPTIDTPKLVSTAFAQAQQNVDQRIKFQASVTCNGGKTAPCNMPTEQTSASSGNAGPFVTSIKIDSFTLSPPAGYSSPKQFKVISSPVGSDLLSGPKYATMRFFAATRSGAPYSYTAKATVTYYTQDWSRNGSTYSWGKKYDTTKQAVLTCTPASCTFSVLGSNLG